MDGGAAVNVVLRGIPAGTLTREQEATAYVCAHVLYAATVAAERARQEATPRRRVGFVRFPQTPHKDFMMVPWAGLE